MTSSGTRPLQQNDAPRRRLVLAEDDDEVRFALAELLVGDGFEVVCVPDGHRLVDYLSRCEQEDRLPDVIVTDHRMPGYTALDVLKGLRDAHWRVPVIVITAFGPDVREPARALGASAVFDKPFDPDDLRTAVLYWTEHPDAQTGRKG